MLNESVSKVSSDMARFISEVIFKADHLTKKYGKILLLDKPKQLIVYNTKATQVHLFLTRLETGWITLQTKL